MKEPTMIMVGSFISGHLIRTGVVGSEKFDFPEKVELLRLVRR